RPDRNGPADRARRQATRALGQRARAARAGHPAAAAHRPVRHCADAVEFPVGKRAGSRMRVGLFVTCLVDLMRPSIGFAALRLLEAGGAEVYVPPTQTCCGQPAYNSGDRADARALAVKMIEEFEGCDWVVAPSGSCSGMVRTHYAELFSDDPVMLRRAEALAARTRELTDFL